MPGQTGGCSSACGKVLKYWMATCLRPLLGLGRWILGDYDVAQLLANAKAGLRCPLSMVVTYFAVLYVNQEQLSTRTRQLRRLRH
jgi:hypothetical protein